MSISRSALFGGFSALAFSIGMSGLAAAQDSPVQQPQNPPAQGTAGPQGSPANSSSPNEVSEVVVTGTRVPGRTRLDTVAPVDVVSAQALQHNGNTELSQALSEVLPSLNFPRPTVTDGTDTVRPVTLRGLAPDQVLVLVNSKRRQTSALVNLNGSVGRGSASVDLNTIPTAAVGTIEVLRDGASAQYGSDAIAGVVNIRLKQASHGGGVSVTVGEYDTEVKTTPAALPAGATWGVQPNRHASDGAIVTTSAWTGLPLGQTGFLTISAEAKRQAHTVRAAPDPRPQYALVNGAYDPRESTINRIGNWFGDPNITQYTFFANAGYDLSSGVHLYGWASYQNRDAVSGGIFRRPCTATAFCAVNLTTQSKNSSIQDIASVYPDGFLPKIAPTVQDGSAAFGATFSNWGWDFDASLVWGTNKIDYSVVDSLNVTLGPSSPHNFDAGGLQYSQTVANLGAVRQVPVAWAAQPLNLAWGLEARLEEFQITAGEPASYIAGTAYTGVSGVPAAPGAQVFPGFTPANALDKTRSSIAAYADVDVKPLPQFDVDAAVRGENYSDFGGVLAGKLAARYDFTPNFALRGAISNGFRAPSLQQTWFTSTSTVFINTSTPTGVQALPFQVLTVPAGSPTAALLGSRPLEPEKSVNFSGGGVARWNGFSLTVDGFYVKIKNRIVLSENLTQSNVVALLPTGISGIRFFTNGVDTETKGVEAVGTYKWITSSFGRFDFVLSASHDETKVTRLPTTNVLAAIPNAPPLFGRVNTLVFEEGQPKWKSSASVDWTGGVFGATVRATYYGNVVSPGSTAAADIPLGDHTLVDVEGRLNLSRNLQAALGVNNLFDEYPNPTPNATAAGFSSYSPFGFNGRFIYGRISYSW